MFKKDTNFKFKNINPSNLDLVLKNIPDLIIINEEFIDVDIIELKKMVRKMATNGDIGHDNGRKYRKYY